MNFISSAGRFAPLKALPSEPVATFNPRDILTTVSIRKRGIALALLLPIAAGAAGAAIVTPRWSAEGLLLVQMSRESAGASDPTGSGPTVVSVEAPKVVQSELEILISDAVLRRAVEAMPAGTVLPQAGDPRFFGLLPPGDASVPAVAQNLRASMLALTSASSNMIRVTVSLPSRERSIVALRAIFDAYLAHRREIFAQGNARVLSVEAGRIGSELRSLDDAIARVRSEARILDLPQDIQLANARLSDITGRIDALREREVSTDAQLQAARLRLTTYPARVVATSETTNAAPNDDNRNALTRLVLERSRMAARYVPDAAPLRELDERIALLKAGIASDRDVRFETVREVRNPALEQLSLRIASLDVETDAAGKQMAELESQRGEARARADALSRAEVHLRDLTRRRDAIEAAFRQIAGREISVRIAEDAERSRSPSVTIAQEPAAAARPRDTRPGLLVMGVLGGIIAAAAAAILLTLFRRSFATRDEAARGLGLPDLASLPTPDDASFQPCMTDLAAMLLDAGLGEERLSIVQFVATGAGDGRGAIGAALAVEMARSRGVRTLLVDLDAGGEARLADLGVPPARAARGLETLQASGTAVPNLWVAAEAGATVLGDPLASRDQTVAVLERLRHEIDAVVVVAPSDAAAYALQRLTTLVDANILVLGATRTDKGAARAARDAVLRAGGRLLGFIMSGERRIPPHPLAQRAS